MTPTEVIPLLIVVLLMLSAGGAEPETMEVVFDGEHAVTSIDDALVVGGGTVTIPAEASVTGRLFVIGGDVRVDGRVDGDVRVLAGNLTLTDGAEVTGELQTVAGTATVADGARVGERTSLDVTPRPRSPLAEAGFLALQVLALGVLAGWVARRNPALLANVGDSIANHAVVSGVVGSIAGATLLVLFVYMAFTLVLLPVSVLGLLAELLLVVYAYVVYGFLIGRRLPVERVDLATAAGAGLFLLGVEALGRVPIAGFVGQFLLVAVGLGAVLITYLGLQRFEPARIPEVGG